MPLEAVTIAPFAVVRIMVRAEATLPTPIRRGQCLKIEIDL
jgi:hypothetical protein